MKGRNSHKRASTWLRLVHWVYNCSNERIFVWSYRPVVFTVCTQM